MSHFMVLYAPVFVFVFFHCDHLFLNVLVLHRLLWVHALSTWRDTWWSRGEASETLRHQIFDEPSSLLACEIDLLGPTERPSRSQWALTHGIDNTDGCILFIF